MPAVTPMMTTVRIRVARLELMPATPSLPNSAVSAAKKAEPSANRIQLALTFMCFPGVVAVEVEGADDYTADTLNAALNLQHQARGDAQKFACRLKR